ncbi:UNVERIFIED_CONTAM: hypothetical protein Sradi_7286900 [Sesamum radiatum]|uniref:Integrase catalytic domain-containing protein n=1 Tax=Sesamum radiatum TaxID=300843 RepID=A0AAW2IJ24_SESRA
MGKGKGKVGSSQTSRMMSAFIAEKKGHWKRECPKLLSSAGTFVIEVNMITNSASWVLDTGCGAHICNDLQVLERSRKLSRDEVVLKISDGKAVAAEAVGIVHLVVSDQWTPPGTPQLNGVSERRNRTLLDMVRSMMSFTELPLSFWGYALETAAKLLNMAPSKTVAQMLYQIWHGKPASYNYLRVWG